MSLPEGLIHGRGHQLGGALHRGEDVKASQAKVPRLKVDTKVEASDHPGAGGLRAWGHPAAL